MSGIVIYQIATLPSVYLNPHATNRCPAVQIHKNDNMVYTIDMVYTVNMVYTVHMVYAWSVNYIVVFWRIFSLALPPPLNGKNPLSSF